MAGTLNLFDGQDLTALSESSPRTRSINTLQIHHATTTSFSGLKSLMDPGGRTVSANGAMANDGWIDEVVILSRRAFTSASSFDNQCLTVEVCNTTLGPQWGISEACRVRLAQLAVAMYRAGILGGLNRTFIIGHFEVPGTYATACPGPDMHLDHIVMLANQMYSSGVAGGGSRPIQIPKESEDMRIFQVNNPDSGGLHGVIYGVAPGAMFCARDYGEGNFLAAQFNPEKKLQPVTEAELRTIIGYHGIPDNLLINLLGGGNWSYDRDGDTLLRQVLAAVQPDAE